MNSSFERLLCTVTLAQFPTNTIGNCGNVISALVWAGGVGCLPTLDAMSIPVAIEDLAAATAEYGWAYLLTVRDDLRPHIVAVSPGWDGDHLMMGVGRGTAANAAARPAISLCFPPPVDGGYSLIVDGTAEVGDDQSIRFEPTGAVLHRPAAPGFAGPTTGCGNDCEPVGPSGGSGPTGTQ